MPQCRKADWGVCFVSKDYAISEYTNKEWQILSNVRVMRAPNRRIAVLLDPIPVLADAVGEAMMKDPENAVCGPMDFDISSNNIQWLLGGDPSREPKGIAEQIHKYITGAYVKSEACAVAAAAPLRDSVLLAAAGDHCSASKESLREARRPAKAQSAVL
jgi:hypothetical protein